MIHTPGDPQPRDWERGRSRQRARRASAKRHLRQAHEQLDELAELARVFD